MMFLNQMANENPLRYNTGQLNVAMWHNYGYFENNF